MSYQGFDLSGRSCLVTGAGSGIGRAIAVGLAQAGADLVVNGRRPEPLEEVAGEIKDQGRGCVVVPGDVGELAFHGQLVAAALEAYGKIDVLVNNAAVLFSGPIEDTTEEMWDTTMGINLKGNFFLALAAGREMIKAGRGRIINLLSNCSFVAEHTIGTYCVAKGGLLMATRCLATEWGPYGLQVNGLAPAFVRTPMNNPTVIDDEFVQWSTNRIPLHRMGKPEEMVGAAVYLASDAASFTNGAVIMCDGGFTAC
jgi:NAD(P)-dependent dehydrogenase (short-subunit alcohol dehydrogenase family)